MITYFKTINKKIKRINNFQSGCWINVLNPTDAEKRFLINKFKLDNELLEEGIDENELPRMDIVDKKTYVFNKFISAKGNELETLLIILTNNFILTLSDEIPKVLVNIIQKRVNLKQRSKFMMKIMDLINDEFEEKTVSIVKDVQSRKIDPELVKKDLKILLNYEEFLNNLITTYQYSKSLYSKMLKNMKFSKHDKGYLEDLIVEAEQGYNLCNTSIKTISNIREYHSIIASNKLNRTITILTIFTVLISIPMAISGIYGMNIPLPLQQDTMLFAYLMAIVVVVCIIFVIYLRKREVL